MSVPPPPREDLTVVNEDDESKWELVVFQVETRVFHSFRHVFTNTSEVFRDMFLLPPGQSDEGTSREKPIVLHGCVENDFASLMKVLHPEQIHVVDSKFDLSEHEWLGVLQLATMWEMKEIRELCVQSMFQKQVDIAPLKLAILAQQFRVRSWFLRAVRDILIGTIRPSTETLISSLGVSMTCRIMDLQMCTLAGVFGVPPGSSKAGSPRALVRLDRLRCGVCRAALFTQPRTCPGVGCQRVHSLEADACTAYVLASAVLMLQSDDALGFSVSTSSVGCIFCDRQLCAMVSCPECYSLASDTNRIFIGYTYSIVERAVEDAFKEELKDYDL
ncbi:hypothetical protein FA13DRAFT_1741950 [Coprinellus micaceus]|uniref:BTB domain-containing protein n=1 Tax=Coprinellus micaceus TaxID=71717 RepID=A0A4Y7SHP5_COPMI|nr:hypothetical protein FA13DRAFT_1741950 [Coprinellus micaceus]